MKEENGNGSDITGAGMAHELTSDRRFVIAMERTSNDISALLDVSATDLESSKQVVSLVAELRGSKERFEAIVSSAKAPFYAALFMIQQKAKAVLEIAESAIKENTADIATAMKGKTVTFGGATFCKAGRQIDVEVENIVKLAKSVVLGKAPASVLKADLTQLRNLARAGVPLAGVKIITTNTYVVRRTTGMIELSDCGDGI